MRQMNEKSTDDKWQEEEVTAEADEVKDVHNFVVIIIALYVCE